MTDSGENGGSADPSPLFRALREAHAHRKSGRLHLVTGRELRQLRFLGGAIADARSDVAGERLGDVLVRHGLLTQSDLDRAVEVVLRERKRLGPVLAEMGLLPEERIREAIGLHAREVVFAALGRAGLTVAFEELPEELVEADFDCPVSVGQLVLDASRRADLAHVRRAIADGGRVLALATDERMRAQKIVLTPADGFVLSRIDGTLRAGDLPTVIPLPREEVERSLFGLLAAGLVAFVEAKAPPRIRREAEPAATGAAAGVPLDTPSPPPATPPAAPVPPPPPASNASVAAGAPAAPTAMPSPEALRKCILEAYRGLERTHYEILGVGQDASPADIRAAYARLMRTFHPDAVRGPGLSDVVAEREAVCLRAGEAYEVLKSEEARAAYDNSLKLWRRKVPAPPPSPSPPPSARAPVAPPAAAAASVAAPERPSPSPPATDAAAPAAKPTGAPLPVAAPAAGAAESLAGAEGGDDPEGQLAAIASATELLGDGEFWDAIQKLEPLLPRLRGQRRARARMLLAQAYAHNPKWRHRAEDALRLAIEDSPQDVEPRLQLASLYVALGLPARAAALYRGVLEIEPRNAVARAALAGGAGPAPADRPAGLLKRLLKRP